MVLTKKISRFALIVIIIFVAVMGNILYVSAAPTDAWWVGGSGNWSDATNHWATSSGGAPDAANLPDSTTNVNFDQNSDTGSANFTVLMNVAGSAKTVDFSAADVVVTFDNKNRLSVYASLILDAGMSVINSGGGTNPDFAFKATSGNWTITTNGASLAASGFSFSGAGGDWTLSDALTVDHIVVSDGVFHSGNQTITVNNTSSQNRSLYILGGVSYLGSSVINITGGAETSDNGALSVTGGTINCESSTITVNKPIYFGAATVNLDSSTITSTYGENSNGYNALTAGSTTTNTASTLIFNPSGVGGLSWAQLSSTSTNFGTIITNKNTLFKTGFTCVNLQLISAAGSDYSSQLSGNITVTGTLTATGNSINNRLTVQSSDATQRTITAGAVSFSNVDFSKINAAGVSSPWDVTAISGGSVDLGGNANITFGTDRYWVGGTGNWSTGHWAFTSNGTPDDIFVPQQPPTYSGQNVHFDANSGFTAGSHTVTLTASAFALNMDWTGAPNTPIFAQSTFDMYVYGNLTLVTGMTNTGANRQWHFRSTTPVTITSAGVSMNGIIIGDQAVGGTFTLVGSITTDHISVTNGTFDTGNYAVNITGGTNGLWVETGAVNLGSSVVTINSASTYGVYQDNAGVTPSISFDSATVTTNKPIRFEAGTVNLGTANITISSGGSFTTLVTLTGNLSTITCDGSFAGNGQEYGTVHLINTGTLAGANTFANLLIDGTGSYTTTLSANQNVTGTFTVDRSVANKAISGNFTITAGTVSMPVSGTRTINITNTDFNQVVGTVSSGYLILSESDAGGGAKFIAGTSSTDNGGNTGWAFADPLTVITPTSSSIASTAATLGGNIVAGSVTTSRGIQYDTDSGAPYANTINEVGAFGNGAFTEPVTGLAPGTLYYYVAYATNDAGTVITVESTFTTAFISSSVSNTIHNLISTLPIILVSIVIVAILGVAFNLSLAYIILLAVGIAVTIPFLSTLIDIIARM